MISLFFTLATAVAASQPVGCKEALTVVPNWMCVENASGIAIAPTQARADYLGVLAKGGEVRFEQHFGQAPARYAIIDSHKDQKVGDQLRALNRLGFRRTLPWLSREAYADAVLTATRMVAEATAKASGLQGVQLETAVDSELSKQRDLLTDYEMNKFESAVVPHEIGHGWYTEAFWPKFVMDRAGHYGSPSPDWLDETAAVLMEGGDSAEERRGQFRDELNEDPRGIDGFITDIARFVTRDHPEKAANQTVREGSANGNPMVEVVPEKETAEGDIDEGILFYLQARVFADYLLDRSGKRDIFADFGRYFASGRSVEQWFAVEGPKRNLPNNLSALNVDFRAWLKARNWDRKLVSDKPS